MAQLTGAKMYVYASIGVGLIGALMSIMGPSAGFREAPIIGGLLSGLGAVAGVVFWKYGYLVIPLITQRTRTVMITSDGYEIPPEQDVIVKASDGVFYASAFLGLRIYESATEKSLEENVNYSQYFERAISNLKYVTKIGYLLYIEDVGEKRKSIETKRAEAQLRLSREREKAEPDVLKLDKYERDVAREDVQLNKLIKGVKPMGVVAYAMTTAAGLSKEAAMAGARTQANELKTLLANALNIEVVQLTADEMMKCFDWETFYPITAHELEESVM